MKLKSLSYFSIRRRLMGTAAVRPCRAEAGDGGGNGGHGDVNCKDRVKQKPVKAMAVVAEGGSS